jgi:hypothetical protein
MYATVVGADTMVGPPPCTQTEDIPMRRTFVALAVTALIPFAASRAQDSVKKELRDVRRAKQELREDKADRRQDARDGAAREVKKDTREIARDERVIRQEKRDVKRAVIKKKTGTP